MGKLTSLPIEKKGMNVSQIIVGLMNLWKWDLTRLELINWVQACLNMGVTTFDLADIYGDYTCENLFGRVLSAEPALRHQMQIITKCGINMVSQNRSDYHVKHYDTSQQHILQSVENSLHQLNTETIDVLLIHRPDHLMDASEVAEAFSKLKKDGKVLHFGVSNFLPSQFDLLSSFLDFPLVTNQISFSLLDLAPLENGTLDQCQKLKIQPMIWSPMSGGKIFRGESDQIHRIHRTIKEIGNSLPNASIDQIILAWLLKHPSNPIPLLGTGKLERLQNAVEATQLTLTQEQWYQLLEASVGSEVP